MRGGPRGLSCRGHWQRRRVAQPRGPFAAAAFPEVRAISPRRFLHVSTLLHLVRHGSNDLLGRRLAGRLPDVHLNAQGLREARLTAEILSDAGIQHIVSSPLPRAMETAQPLAESLGLPVEAREAFIEVNFGLWEGRSMADLEADLAWREFQRNPALRTYPGGESLVDLQSRVVKGLEKLRREWPGKAVALYAHGDVLKVALAWHLGMPLDFFSRIVLSPASVSVVEISDGQARVLGINQRHHLGPGPAPAH